MLEADQHTQQSDGRLAPGTIVDGRYRIVRELGEGGFAVVYAAEHTTLERPAALKVLDLTGNSREVAVFRERFAREAKIAARIEHPNVVKVFDYGFVRQTNQPYIAMELLEGRDLEEELCEHGPLEPERALRLFDGVLDALGNAHRNGVVHKDLKPSNLFIKHPGTPRERMVVLDYGIARLHDAPDAKLTQTNQYTGTPAYAAPEYIQSQRAEPPLDVYQMGLIIAESLTGTPVVQASSPMAFFVAHCNGKQRIDDSLKGTPIGEVLTRAVAVAPEDRYPDAEALRQALAAIDPASAPDHSGTRRQATRPPTSAPHLPERARTDRELLESAPTLGPQEPVPPVTTPPPTTAPPATSPDRPIEDPRQGLPAPPTAQVGQPGEKKRGLLLPLIGCGGLLSVVVALGLIVAVIVVQKRRATSDTPPRHGASGAKISSGAQGAPGGAAASRELIAQKLHQVHMGLGTVLGPIDEFHAMYMFGIEAHGLSRPSALAMRSPRAMPRNFDLADKSIESATSTSPNFPEFEEALSRYRESLGKIGEIYRELDEYWRIDKDYKRDAGARARVLNKKLQLYWKRYARDRDTALESIFIANTKLLEKAREGASPGERAVADMLIELQRVHRASTLSPHDAKAHKKRMESFRRKSKAAREAGPGPLIENTNTYLESMREFGEAHKNHPRNTPGDQVQRVIARAELHGEYFRVMQLYYQRRR